MPNLEIIINGVKLTEGEALTVNVALQSLKMAMNEAKNSMPTTNDFQSLFSNFKTSISSANQQMPAEARSIMPSGTEFESAFLKGIDMLNTNVKQLITAVEDGTSKNVKAVKSSGNMIA